MSTVTIHGTSGLVTSTVTHSGVSGIPIETACLHGKMLYSSVNLLESCPFAKTQEKCMDDLRSRSIFQNIPEHTNNLSTLTNAVNICTPGMKSLVEKINSDRHSSSVDKIRANELQQICKF